MLHGNSHMYQISDSSQQVFFCTAEVTYKYPFFKKKVLCKNQEVHKLLIFHLTLGGSPIRLNFLATFGTFSKAYFFPLDFARSIAL